MDYGLRSPTPLIQEIQGIEGVKFQTFEGGGDPNKGAWTTPDSWNYRPSGRWGGEIKHTYRAHAIRDSKPPVLGVPFVYLRKIPQHSCA